MQRNREYIEYIESIGKEDLLIYQWYAGGKKKCSIL